jgi:hypothetical protein
MQPKSSNSAGKAQASSLTLAQKFIGDHPTWYIFPIAPLAKEPPCITNNLEAASNDPAQIAAWSAQFPGCGWGLASKKSGVIVVDSDCKPGKNGQQTIDNLDLEYGAAETNAFPPTLMVATPSGHGSNHKYYSGAHQFGLGKHGFGEGVDSPNYVLIPGCKIKRDDGTVGA